MDRLSDILIDFAEKLRAGGNVHIFDDNTLRTYSITLLERYKYDLLSSYAERTKKHPAEWIAKNITMLPVAEYLGVGLGGAESDEDPDTCPVPQKEYIPLPPPKVVPQPKQYTTPTVVQPPKTVPQQYTEQPQQQYTEQPPKVVQQQSSPQLKTPPEPKDTDDSEPDDQERDPESSASGSDSESLPPATDAGPNSFDYEMNNEIDDFPDLKEVSLKYTGTLTSHAGKHKGYDGVIITYQKDSFPEDLRAQLEIMHSGTEYRMLFGLPYTEGLVCDIIQDNQCFFYINRRYRQTEDYLFDKLKYIFGCPHIQTKA